MLSILNLFGRSPFSLLQAHMEKVSSCVHLLRSLFEALKKKDHKAVGEIGKEIAEAEHAADIIKNDIRNHLPKSLFLAMDRQSLLDILSIQDSIADKAEDIAVLATLKPLILLDSLQQDFDAFLDMNIKTFDEANAIIHELQGLLESSFGGVEAEKVRSKVESIAFKEHEVDIIQIQLLKKFFQAEENFSLSTFHLWQRIFESIGALSNLSENLAYRLRTTLELK